MAEYFFHMVRTYKPGLFPIVELQQALEGMDIQGYVTISPDNMTGSDGGFTSVTTRVFDSVSEWEAFDDAVIGSSQEMQALRNSIASKTVSAKGFAFRSIEDFENNTGITPKYMSRSFIRAKHGRQQEVVDILKEIRTSIPAERNRPNISVLINGPSNVVRLALPVPGLEAIEGMLDTVAKIGESDLGKKLIAATEGSRRQISRFVATHNLS